MRLRFMNPPPKNPGHDPSYVPESEDFPAFKAYLDAWNTALLNLPRDGFAKRTIILDVYPLIEMYDEIHWICNFNAFAKRLGTREMVWAKGKCGVRFDGDELFMLMWCEEKSIPRLVRP